MGNSDEIRISCAVTNELYSIYVVGSSEFLHVTKKEIDWKVEAQADATLDRVSGNVKASYG